MESKVPKVLFIRYFFNDSILCDWWCRFSRYAEGYNEFISQLIIPIFSMGIFNSLFGMNFIASISE